MPVLLAGLAGPDAALTDATGTTSWSDLAARVDRWIRLLRARGLGPGDTVAVLMGNGRETFVVLLALLHTGATAVPVNWHLTAPEVAYILADSGARALIADPGNVSVAARACAEAPGCTIRLVTGGSPDPAAGDLPVFRAADPLLETAPPPQVEEQPGGLMLYTSGTTGSPKGVNNGLFTAGAEFARTSRLLGYAGRALGVPSDGRVLLAGPWYHSAQLFFALLPLLSGSPLVIHDRFDPAAVLAAIDAEEITALHLVPTQFIRLLRLDSGAREAFGGASLRRVWHGGGPCPPDVKERMIAWWGPVLTEYYAATEAGVVTLIDSADWLCRPGSVGRALSPHRILITSPDGAELPAGETGRVFIERPGKGFTYHNAAEKTRAAHLADGVFTFGELGHLDADGYLYLTGRVEGTIVSGGVNIYPAEVEAVLVRHPLIRDAAVLGVPDPEFGERVLALVETEPAPGDLVVLSRLLDAHCRRSLAGFKVPRAYRFVDALPREESGKLRRDLLREASTATEHRAVEVTQ